MITISLNNLGKKFNKEWIFRNLSYEILPGQKLLISGGNGSGKSTLLQVISGFVTPNEGEVVCVNAGKKIEQENNYIYFSFASPYLQLIEDFTLIETIEHIAAFKPFAHNISASEVIKLTELQNAKDKLVKQFSSGMKQRLKLGLAILANTPVLLLDEPVSNLDKNAINWYKNLVGTYSQNRTVIVCSNTIGDEHFFCDRELSPVNFKPKKQL